MKSPLVPLRLCLVLMLSACGAGPLAYLKSNPPTELTCPAEEWKTEQIGGSGLIYVTGCGEVVRYFAQCNPSGLCLDQTHVVVSTGLRRQAAFDLKCDEHIELTRLAQDTFGTRGCGRQASYSLVRCGISECELVQNTQSQ